MTFIGAIRSGFKNYVNFQGRASRSAYWWWALFQFIVEAATVLLAHLLAGANAMAGAGGLLIGVVALGLFLPSLGLYVRRLHDTNHSGWWIFLGCVPLVGGIVLLIWTILKGTAGPNKYGPDPLAPDVTTVF